jgi:excisionase family DNA binding protein
MTLLTSTEAANALGISAQRVRQLIAKKRLPSEFVSGVHLIRLEDLDKVRRRKPGRPTAASIARRMEEQAK